VGREKNIPYWKVLTDVTNYVKNLEKKWKNNYNVYIYKILPYPPNKKEEMDNKINLSLFPLKL
jgi:hypothetical protein